MNGLPAALRRRQRAAAPGFLVLALALPASALAQQGSSRDLLPTFDTELTYIDVERAGLGRSQSELTTQLRPGFRYTSRTGRLQGAVSYGLGLTYRSRTDPSFDASNQLTAALTGQLVENLAFVDVSASIAKQSLSAFGQQSVAEQPTENPNQEEVGNLSITPSLRGNLAGLALVDLRLNATAANTRKSIEGDSLSTGGTLTLSSTNPNAIIGWGLSASTITTDYRTRGDAKNDRATASVEIRPDVDVSLSVRAGRETTDIGLSQSESFSNWGASLRWQPSPRTLASFNTDRRFFGRSHSINLSYRLPLSSLRFGSVRDVTLSANPGALGQPLTLYDLFFEQFASQEPDPALRQQLVLDFLAGLGLDPQASIAGGAINRGPTVQERNDIGFTYSAKRLTLSGQAFASRTQQLLEAGLPAPSDANPRQRGYTGTVAYRLTPTATFSLLGSRLMTKPTANQTGTDLKSLGLTLSERLGRLATAAINARYSVFNSATNPYRETAVSASLGLRF
ncbi:hypothetical protein D621_17670 [beta proteobacterium AAP51]|nr:hypothetical protein D621_17670 [beta proteobacterium AAP51]